MFYLPKILYNNLQTLAKENHISITEQIIICLDYTNSHIQEYKEQIKKYSNSLYTEEQLKYIDTVHFSERFTSPKLKKYLNSQNPPLTQIEIVNRLKYGQHYKEIEERRELCHKYKLNCQTMSTKN